MSKAVTAGKVIIGGGNPITVQSMTNTKTSDYEATAKQINRLVNAGCSIVRLAVTSPDDLAVCRKLLPAVSALLVADIQYDYKIAIACSDMGFKKIRINPGNIGDESKIKALAEVCRKNGTVIRVGVNSGSVDQDILAKYGNTAEALVESALRNVKLLEKYNFTDTVISVKSSNVTHMIRANKLLNDICDYPLHLGVTESGPKTRGLVKSSIGIGALLSEGIGDTVRVSLSADPLEEVKAARMILQSLGVDSNYCEIISCPTCSRCNFDLFSIVEKVSKLTENISERLKIAIMGCTVNGPGEAKEADFGVAGGAEKAVVFKKGQVIKTIDNSEILEEVEKYISEYMAS